MFIRIDPKGHNPSDKNSGGTKFSHISLKLSKSWVPFRYDIQCLEANKLFSYQHFDLDLYENIF